MSDKRGSIGRDFERAISDGINNNDWSNLNNVIVKTVDEFLDGVGDKMNDAMSQSAGAKNHSSAVPLSRRKEDFSGSTQTAKAQRKLHEERARVRRQMEEERRERERIRKQKQIDRTRGIPSTQLGFPYRRVGGGATALRITGGIGLGVSGIALLKAGITGAITGMLSTGVIAVSVVAIAAFAGVLIKGIRMSTQTALADRYARAIGKRQYIDIATLALSVNRSEKRVIRDLKKLIDAGYFPQGRFDRGYTTLILTDETFEQYLSLEKQGTSSVIDTTARDGDEQQFPTLSAEESAELSRMIREGNEYISLFHEINADIPGVEITAKLDRLEGLLREIFVSIKKHPEQMSRIHELMDYYLPTAKKLVEAYREYDNVSEPGKEILDAKQQIENTLDTINSALGKLLNKLFKDSVLDVTTDADVLKTMLAQKGLATGNDQ